MCRRPTQQHHPLALTHVDCAPHSLGFEVIKIWRVQNDDNKKKIRLQLQRKRTVFKHKTEYRQWEVFYMVYILKGFFKQHTETCFWCYTLSAGTLIGHHRKPWDTRDSLWCFQRHLGCWWNSWTWLDDIYPALPHSGKRKGLSQNLLNWVWSWGCGGGEGQETFCVDRTNTGERAWQMRVCSASSNK